MPFKVKKSLSESSSDCLWTEIKWMEWDVRTLAFAGIWLKSAVVSDLPWWDPCHSFPAPIKIRVLQFPLLLQFNEGLLCIFGHECLPQLLKGAPNGGQILAWPDMFLICDYIKWIVPAKCNRKLTLWLLRSCLKTNCILHWFNRKLFPVLRKAFCSIINGWCWQLLSLLTSYLH